MDRGEGGHPSIGSPQTPKHGAFMGAGSVVTLTVHDTSCSATELMFELRQVHGVGLKGKGGVHDD